MDGGFIKSKHEEKAKIKLINDDLTIPVSEKEKCKYCESVSIVIDIKKKFLIFICKKCIYKNLALITKTECKKKYLLTEEEICSFKHIYRPNPHAGTWSEMQLFMESEIAEFANKKFGTVEKLQNEKKERIIKLKERKIKKIKKNIKNMKKRTFLEKREEEHKHKFKTIKNKGVCECGIEVELEEF